MEGFPVAGLFWFYLAVWGHPQHPVSAAPPSGTSSVSSKLHWTYNDEQAWAAKFPTCGGSQQSPIDIRNESTEYDPYLVTQPLRLLNFSRESSQASFNQDNLLYNFTNKGHSVTVMVSGEMMVEGADIRGQFRTDSFHFHWGNHSDHGSEHAIGGVKYPLEMHVVNYNTRYGSMKIAEDKSDGLMVLAAMFELSKYDNSEFEPLSEALRYISKSGDHHLVNNIKLRWMLPTSISQYYLYQGSLTTPPCYESVTWVIFSEPHKISERQLARLRSLVTDVGATQMVDNWRPPKPLAGRVVRRSFQTPGHPVLAPACRSDKIDMAFVIDSSNSIWIYHFNFSLNFMSSFVDNFDLNPDVVRVAAIPFGKGAFENYAIQFDQYHDRKDLLTALDDIGKPVALWRNTYAGIQYMREKLMSRSRPEALKVCIVLTDNRSHDPPKTAREAKLAQDAGIVMFAVGVGNVTEQPEFKKELQDIAGADSRVLTAQGHTDINIIKNQLTKSICSEFDSFRNKPGRKAPQ